MRTCLPQLGAALLCLACLPLTAQAAPVRATVRVPVPEPTYNDMARAAFSASFGPSRFRVEDSGDSDSESGREWDLTARFVPARHLLIDLDYAANRVDGDGDATLDFNRFNGGIGFLGYIGRQGTWFIKGLYTNQRLELDCPGCGGASSTKDGVGAKVGFLIPFAHRWIASVGGGYTRLNASDGDDAFDEFGFNLGMEFRVNPVLGLFVTGNADYYQDSDYSDLNFTVTSFRAGLSVNFR